MFRVSVSEFSISGMRGSDSGVSVPRFRAEIACQALLNQRNHAEEVAMLGVWCFLGGEGGGTLDPKPLNP